MIRSGISVDKVNGYGQTPLLQALERMSELQLIIAANTGRTSQDILEKEQIQNAQRRVRYIAVVLIEQHANVNATVDWDGKVVSAIHFACHMADWDLVALLLKHGANPKPALPRANLNLFLPTPAAKQRFSDLTAQGTNAGRPPRICPCFSGHPLSKCHSEELPLPDHFTCHCGTKNIREMLQAAQH
jgi:ankyrin repeat protein